jgi:hypothetical protein
MTRMTRSQVLRMTRVLAGVVLLLAACSGSRVERTRTTGVDIAGTPHIFIDNFSGDIEVSTGSAGRVEAQATLFAPAGQEATLDGLDFVFSADATQVRGASQWANGGQPAADTGIDLSLSVPPGANLEVRNGAGRIRYRGTPGGSSLVLTTGIGDVGMKLPPETTFRIDALAAIGSIATNYPLAVSRTATGATLKGMMGENPTLQIEATTGNGKISLERQQP